MLASQRLPAAALAAFLLLSLVWYFSAAASAPSITLPSLTEPLSYAPLSTRPAALEPILKGPVAYDKETPPSIGCEDVVYRNQRVLIDQYSSMFDGIRYANIIGYFDNEDKGNAAVWAGQWMLLSMLGITPMEICRFIDKDCDLARFKAMLEAHAPHSTVILSGGGNFTDETFWEDMQSRMKAVAMFPEYKIRTLPTSVTVADAGRILETKRAFGSHKNLKFIARDLPSWNWIVRNYGRGAEDVTPNQVKFDILPDVTFMWGSRPDLRTKPKKTHNILLLHSPTSDLSPTIPSGEGLLDLGNGANITYHKLDWTTYKTPNIDDTHDPISNERTSPETGAYARAYARARTGFNLLGSVDFVITDVMEAHVMSTVTGVPHVYVGRWDKHWDTWTRDAKCARVSDSVEEALGLARLYFEKFGGLAG